MKRPAAILACTQQPFAINGQTAGVGASVGIAMAPADAIGMAQLMQRADLALYKAKADGRNLRAFLHPAARCRQPGPPGAGARAAAI